VRHEELQKPGQEAAVVYFNVLFQYIKERRGYSHLKKEALDRTVWRAGFEEALDLS
jgi:hypothetical protein